MFDAACKRLEEVTVMTIKPKQRAHAHWQSGRFKATLCFASQQR